MEEIAFYDQYQAEREYEMYRILAKVRKAQQAGFLSADEFDVLLLELGADGTLIE